MSVAGEVWVMVKDDSVPLRFAVQGSKQRSMELYMPLISHLVQQGSLRETYQKIKEVTQYVRSNPRLPSLPNAYKNLAREMSADYYFFINVRSFVLTMLSGGGSMTSKYCKTQLKAYKVTGHVEDWVSLLTMYKRKHVKECESYRVKYVALSLLQYNDIAKKLLPDIRHKSEYRHAFSPRHLQSSPTDLVTEGLKVIFLKAVQPKYSPTSLARLAKKHMTQVSLQRYRKSLSSVEGGDVITYDDVTYNPFQNSTMSTSPEMYTDVVNGLQPPQKNLR